MPFQQVKGKSDHYWIIGIHGTPPQIRCILCKGLTYPTTLPRPVATTLPLNIPVCEQSTEKGQLEV
jgi:chromosome transmission fidelity protein 4